MYGFGAAAAAGGGGFLQRVQSITSQARDQIASGGSGAGIGGGSAASVLKSGLSFIQKDLSSSSGSSGFFSSSGGQVITNSMGNILKQPNIQSGRNELILLVIDDENTDWSKYFRGRRLQFNPSQQFEDASSASTVTDPQQQQQQQDQIFFDIRIEQANFYEISILSGSEFGCIVSVNKTVSDPNEGSTMNYNAIFQPSYILIRQNIKDTRNQKDYKNLILSLNYGGIPSINSLSSIYNFQDKPWVYSNMVNLNANFNLKFFNQSNPASSYKSSSVSNFSFSQSLRKLSNSSIGSNSDKDNFNNLPIIDQIFFTNYNEMFNFVPKIPTVLKIGHAHGGLGKIRISNLSDFQDASSVVAITGNYATVEPYIEARCNVHIQKIGNQYKAFMRKCIIPGQWKTGSGSSNANMLEQIQISEKYKIWIDNVSKLFGGLDICALEVLIGKDGSEYIIEVNDSTTMNLIGESQEDDRRYISELIMNKMYNIFCCGQPPQNLAMGSAAAVADARRKSSTTTTSSEHLQQFNMQQQPPSESSVSPMKMSSASSQGTPPTAGSGRRKSSTSSATTVTSIASAASSQPQPPPAADSSAAQASGGGGGFFSQKAKSKIQSGMNSFSFSNPFSSGGSSQPPPQPPQQQQPASSSSAISSGGGGGDSSGSGSSGNKYTPPSLMQNNPGENKGTNNSSNNPNTSGNTGNIVNQQSTSEDTEDTMKNLRKTFAGIFGDM